MSISPARNDGPQSAELAECVHSVERARAHHPPRVRRRTLPRSKRSTCTRSRSCTPPRESCGRTCHARNHACAPSRTGRTAPNARNHTHTQFGSRRRAASPCAAWIALLLAARPPGSRSKAPSCRNRHALVVSGVDALSVAAPNCFRAKLLHRGEKTNLNSGKILGKTRWAATWACHGAAALPHRGGGWGPQDMFA